GAPVLLLAPRLKDAAKGFGIATGVVLVQLAPFALFGHFRMFDYEWRVAEGTLVSLAVPVGTHFGWPLRFMQAAAACGLRAAVALRFRRSVHAVWLVPFVVVVARIALDPLAYGWYWLEAEALALVGAGALLAAPPLARRASREDRGVAEPSPAIP